MTATRAGFRTDSTASFRATPARTAGIVATTSSQASRRSGSWPIDRSRMAAKPAGISRSQSARKYTSSATSVAIWSITLNARLLMNGSVKPSRNGTTMRWPELETGRNSVSPWTTPMTSACSSVSMSCAGARSPSRLADEQRSEHQRDRGEELHEDVERRAGCVLEGIADGVTDDSRGMRRGLLAEDHPVLVHQVARLDVLLGVVP